jgi:hypothetical protein
MIKLVKQKQYFVQLKHSDTKHWINWFNYLYNILLQVILITSLILAAEK